MAVTEVVNFALAAAATGVMAWAALSDVSSRRIPNAAVGVLFGLFLFRLVLDRGAGAVSSFEAAGLSLVLTFGLYAFKVVGAGDSKLFTAAALFAGMVYLPYLALATALAGGALAVISFASRPQRALAMITLRGKGDWGPGVPYGVAVACGFALVLWGSLTGWLQPYGIVSPHPIISHIVLR
jgi:prepilin peptidase CpaA